MLIQRSCGFNWKHRPVKKEPLAANGYCQNINQAALLEKLQLDAARLFYLSGIVKSGDTENCEGRAASYYWKVIFDNETLEFESQYGSDSQRDMRSNTFKRHRFGEPPNNLLNYGYAILRGVVARSLVASGLLTAMGIHHRNKYNPYCLADDLMEPYRPLVDGLVLKIVEENQEINPLTPALKRKLLQIPAMDILIGGQTSPLMVGMQRTTASLMQCFEGESRKLVFPELN